MFLAIVTMLFCQASGSANPQQALTPSARYDPGIPTLKQVTGHAFGDEITPPEQIAIYLKALAAAAPDRTRLAEYARSWEGRPLHLLAIGSSQRMAAVDKVKEDLRRLADPRKLSTADAEQLLRELPVVTLLTHAVHGNEISSPEAAMAMAYHLLASQQDAAVDNILRESIVLIDPLENPDGRARFVTHTLLGRSASPDAEPAAVEHDESWPGGRSNHYLFDMNRDWFAQTQPESRGRTSYYLEWYPHVVADLHEMGGNSTYYFAPPADPLNPHITKQQASLLELFGKENAKRFDERGFAYFKHEQFDSFYPGYGESWPIFHGAIGMTYEQASTRGLVWRRPDETQLTYLEAIVHHFTAALTTAETAARNRTRILREFLEYRRSAVLEGERGPIREYLMPPGPDPARTARLARLIAEQGIEVRKSDEPIRTAARTLPAGTYIFPLAQPASRLLRNLVDPNIPQPEAFVKEQDRRRKKRLDEQFYDITGWSLPQAFDVEVVTTDRATEAKSTPLLSSGDSKAAALPKAKVAYLIPWGTGAAAAVAEALRAGIRVQTADDTFTLTARKYPVGTAIVRVTENSPELLSRLGAIAARHGAEVVATDTGYVEDGISLGSGEVRPLKQPRVLLAWDSPTQSTSAGWARYVLERRYGLNTHLMPPGCVTSVRTASYRSNCVMLLASGLSGT